jgi:hypothetical protein
LDFFYSTRKKQMYQLIKESTEHLEDLVVRLGAGGTGNVNCNINQYNGTDVSADNPIHVTADADFVATNYTVNETLVTPITDNPISFVGAMHTAGAVNTVRALKVNDLNELLVFNENTQTISLDPDDATIAKITDCTHVVNDMGDTYSGLDERVLLIGGVNSNDETYMPLLLNNSSYLMTQVGNSSIAVTNDGLGNLNSAIGARDFGTLGTVDNMVLTGMLVQDSLNGVDAHPAQTGQGNSTTSTLRVNISNNDTNLAAMNTNLGTLAATVGSSKVNVQVQNWPVTQAVSGTVNATCSGTVNATCSGTVNATCSGTVNATCSGTVGVTNADLTTIATNSTTAVKTETRRSLNSIEVQNVCAYKMIYKSHYAPSLATLQSMRFESFSSNANPFGVEGGVRISAVSGTTAWQGSTRFALINSNDTFLIIFPGLLVTDVGGPSIDIGIQYQDNSKYLYLRNNYTSNGNLSIVYDISEISATVARTSWNVDIFNGSGLSGIDLSGAKSKEPLAWFITVSGCTNQITVGLVENGKLYPGHQLNLKRSGTLGNNSFARCVSCGFRPFVRNQNPTTVDALYFGGFEIYSMMNSMEALRQLPYRYQHTGTIGPSVTLYLFSIRLNESKLCAGYIRLKNMRVITDGAGDLGDFRVDIKHAVDTQYSEVGASSSTSQSISRFAYDGAPFAGGDIIANYYPNSSHCVAENLEWITPFYFGYDQAHTNPSYIYITATNLSASVTKELHFSINWTE